MRKTIIAETTKKTSCQIAVTKRAIIARRKAAAFAAYIVASALIVVSHVIALAADETKAKPGSQLHFDVPQPPPRHPCNCKGSIDFWEKRCREIQKQHGGNTLEYARALNFLAEVLRYNEKFDQAEPAFASSLKLKSALLPADDLELAKTKAQLGIMYFEAKKPEKAKPLWKEASSTFQTQLAKAGPRRAAILEELGEIYTYAGDAGAARNAYLQALALEEKQKGANDIDLAERMERLSLYYRQPGQYNVAEDLLRRAIALRERHHGRQPSEKLSWSRQSLAGLYLGEDKFAEAQAQLHAAAALEKKQHPAHSELATTIDTYAKILERAGKANQAKQLQADAKALRAGAAKGPESK
jgi:hypothetical protein